jgi:hypothetical protein
MKRQVHLEWVSENIALNLFRKRLKKAEEKRGPEAISGQTEDNLWDWVEMEEALESRRFPNIGMAKAHSLKHPKLDMFEQPRIVVQEESEDDRDELQTVLELQYEGDGVWRNVQTGVVENA